MDSGWAHPASGIPFLSHGCGSLRRDRTAAQFPRSSHCLRLKKPSLVPLSATPSPAPPGRRRPSGQASVRLPTGARRLEPFPRNSDASAPFHSLNVLERGSIRTRGISPFFFPCFSLVRSATRVTFLLLHHTRLRTEFIAAQCPAGLAPSILTVVLLLLVPGIGRVFS